MARGVRQGCPASGFLFAMAFDPIFRWLQDSIIPRDRAAPHYLLPSPCAHADDFAVVASSFRSLVAALSPASVVIDRVVGLNFNHRKCCWVQYGSDSCHVLLDWVSVNCEEANCQVGQERWHNDRKRGLPPSMDSTAGKFIQRARKIHGSSKSFVERLVDSKIFHYRTR